MFGVALHKYYQEIQEKSPRQNTSGFELLTMASQLSTSYLRDVAVKHDPANEAIEGLHFRIHLGYAVNW